MAQLVLTVGGQLAGAALGGPIGAAIGGALGGFAYRQFFAESPPDQYGPRFEDASVTSSALGQMIPLVWGTMPVAGNIIDASPVRTVSKKTSTGGGKGSAPEQSVTTYTHYADLDVLIGEGVIQALLQIWCNGVLIYDATPSATIRRPDWLDFTWYPGTENQRPDPTFQALHGTVPAYKGMAHCVFRNFRLDEFGLGESIALNFRFVVVRAGEGGIAETIIDSQTIDPAAEDINAIAWSTHTDSMIVALDTTASTSTATHTIYAVDPYTKTVIWQRDAAGGTSEQSAVSMALAAVPRYAGDVQINGPDEHAVYQLTHSGTTAESLEVIDVATGEVYSRVTLPDEYPPFWIVAPFADRMDLFIHRQTGLGSGGVVRADWSDANRNWTFNTLTAPSGWSFSAQQSPATDREGGVLWLVTRDSDDARGVVLTDFAALDTLGSAAIVEPVTVLTDIDSVETMLHDPAQDAFLVIGLDSSSDLTLIKIGSDGAEVDRWNLSTLLSVSGTPLWGDMSAGINRSNGTLVFGMDGRYFVMDTADPGAGAITYTMPTATKGGGAVHPYTGSFWTNGSGLRGEDLHIVQLGAVNADGESLKTVCDEIMQYDGTLLQSADIDNDALEPITVQGFAIARANMARSAALQMLMAAYLFDIVPRDGVLTAMLRGTAAGGVTVDDDHLGAHVAGSEPGPRLSVTRINAESLPRRMTVRHVNPAQNWEEGAEQALRLASDTSTGREERIDLAVSLTTDEAAQLADILLHMRHIEAEQYAASLMPSLVGDVQPGKRVAIVDGDEILDARVESANVVDGQLVEAALTRYDASIYSAYSVGGVVRNPGGGVYAIGSAIPLLADTPALRLDDFDAGYYVTAYSYTPGWPGAQVFRSPATVESYTAAGFIGESATVGVIREITGTLRPMHYDFAASLSVQLLAGDDFPDEALADFESSRTLNAVLIGQPGRWVIGRYLSSTADGSRYTLTGLIIGMQGTEQHIASIAAGDMVVQISETTMGRVSLYTDSVGQTELVKTVTVGRTLDAVVPRTLAVSGAALKPLPPEALHATGFGGDITLTWVRCEKRWTRPFWAATNSDTNTYTVDILDSSGDVVRTLSASSETATYTAAQQTADFGAGVDFVRWRVAQISADGLTGFYTGSASGSKVSWAGLVMSYSPIVYLPFDDAVGSGTIVDASGNGNDGTNPDSYSLLGIAGAFGTAIDLSENNDSGESINLGNDTSLQNINSGSFSIAFWLKGKSAAPASIGSIINQNTGVDLYFVDESGSMSLYMRVDFSTTDARYQSGPFTLTQDWQFFCATFDGSAKTGAIYIDGAEVGSYQNQTAGVGTPATSTNDTIVGALGMEQYLDELFIVPVELSAAQVAELHAKRTE